MDSIATRITVISSVQKPRLTNLIYLLVSLHAPNFYTPGRTLPLGAATSFDFALQGFELL